MAIAINRLKPARGANRKRKRVGRGIGSGHSKTATRGYKGQKSRSGTSVRPGFEGGQMPLHRRCPKRAFHNVFRKEYALVNLEVLARFEAGENFQVYQSVFLAEHVVEGSLGAAPVQRHLAPFEPGPH